MAWGYDARNIGWGGLGERSSVPPVRCGRHWSGSVSAGQSCAGGRAVPAAALPRLRARVGPRRVAAATGGWMVAAVDLARGEVVGR